MPSGVYIRNEETKKKCRIARIGKPHSHETKRRIAEKMKDMNVGRKRNDVAGERSHMKKPEMRKYFSDIMKNGGSAIANAFNKGPKPNRRNGPLAMFLKYPEMKAKLSIRLKEWWAEMSEDEKRERVAKAFIAQKQKPNKTEIFTDSLIQKARPTDFIYSGDGKIFIAGKVPDWFNVNGKKQVIEMLGTYWHGVERTGRTKEQEENYLKSHYAKYGYDCLIIWQSELKCPEKVIEKIKQF